MTIAVLKNMLAEVALGSLAKVANSRVISDAKKRIANTAIANATKTPEGKDLIELLVAEANKPDLSAADAAKIQNLLKKLDATLGTSSTSLTLDKDSKDRLETLKGSKLRSTATATLSTVKHISIDEAVDIVVREVSSIRFNTVGNLLVWGSVADSIERASKKRVPKQLALIVLNKVFRQECFIVVANTYASHFNKALTNISKVIQKPSDPNGEKAKPGTLSGIVGELQSLSNSLPHDVESTQVEVLRSFKIDKDDIREAYKANIHVLQIGLFAQGIIRDLKAIDSFSIKNANQIALERALGPIYKASGGVPNYITDVITSIDSYYSMDGKTTKFPDRVFTVKAISGLEDAELETALQKILQDYSNQRFKTGIIAEYAGESEKITKEVDHFIEYLELSIGKLAGSYVNSGKYYAHKVKEVIDGTTHSALVFTNILSTFFKGKDFNNYFTYSKGKLTPTALIVPSEYIDVTKARDPFNRTKDICTALGQQIIKLQTPKDWPLIHSLLVKLGSVENSIFDAGHVESVVSFSTFIRDLRRSLAAIGKTSGGVKITSDHVRNAYAELTKLFDTSDKSRSTTRAKVQASLVDPTSGISALLAEVLVTELYEVEGNLNRKIASNGSILLNFITSYDKLAKESIKDSSPEFLKLQQQAQEILSPIVNIKIESSTINRAFGRMISRAYISARSKYIEALIKELEKDLDKTAKGSEGYVNLQGSPSLKQMVASTLLTAMKTGKLTSDIQVTKVSANKPGKKANISAKSKKSVKAKKRKSAKVNQIKSINVKAAVNAEKVKYSNSAKVNSKKPKGAKKLKIPSIKPFTTTTTIKLKSNKGNSLKSVTNIQNLLNLELFNTIRRNMTTPKLNFRTGRLAASAQIQSITHGTDDVIDIRYTYMRNIYGTFEPGGKQGSPSRDPKVLISGSIREVLRGQILQKLRITRV